MAWQAFSFWEIILDVIALCLCGTAVIALVRDRRRRVEKQPTGDSAEFREVLGRMNTERAPASELRQPMLPPGKTSNLRTDAIPGDRYHEVEDLADSGRSIEEIFQSTGVPRGEIALVLKMRQQTNAFLAESGGRRAAAG